MGNELDEVFQEVVKRQAAAEKKPLDALRVMIRRAARGEVGQPAEWDKGMKLAGVGPDECKKLVEEEKARIHEIEQYFLLRERVETYLRTAEPTRAEIKNLEKLSKEYEEKARRLRAELNSLSGAMVDASALLERIVRECPDRELRDRRATIMERIRECNRVVHRTEQELEAGEVRWFSKRGNEMTADAVATGHRNEYRIERRFPLPADREAEARGLIEQQTAAKRDLQAELASVEAAMLEI